MIETSRKQVKHKFTDEEDKELDAIVKEIGFSSWKLVSMRMKNRTPRQCKERWINYLQPNINKDKWTKPEDDLLFYLVNKLGSKWNTLSSYFNNRPPVILKNRFNILSRHIKRLERSKLIADTESIEPYFDFYFNSFDDMQFEEC